MDRDAGSGMIRPMADDDRLGPLGRLATAVVVSAVLLVAAGCGLAGGTLGGRQTCWPESDQRAASLWRGVLRIDATGASLDTPEGDVIPLAPGAVELGVAELVQGANVVARPGDDITLFGGAGADGYLVVCAVEEVHARA